MTELLRKVPDPKDIEPGTILCIGTAYGVGRAYLRTVGGTWRNLDDCGPASIEGGVRIIAGSRAWLVIDPRARKTVPAKLASLGIGAPEPPPRAEKQQVEHRGIPTDADLIAQAGEVQRLRNALEAAQAQVRAKAARIGELEEALAAAAANPTALIDVVHAAVRDLPVSLREEPDGRCSVRRADRLALVAVDAESCCVSLSAVAEDGAPGPTIYTVADLPLDRLRHTLLGWFNAPSVFEWALVLADTLRAATGARQYNFQPAAPTEPSFSPTRVEPIAILSRDDGSGRSVVLEDGPQQIQLLDRGVVRKTFASPTHHARLAAAAWLGLDDVDQL